MTDNARQAMEVLREYHHIDKRAREVEERIARCREDATRATASMTAVRTSGTGERSRIETAVVRMVDIQDQLGDILQQAATVRIRIQTAINATRPEEYKRLLELRYIDGNQWDEVNEALYISRSTSYRWHAAALEEFWIVYKNMEHYGTE